VSALDPTVAALQAQNAVLRQLVMIHDRLSALVLQGADVAAITRMLSDLVGRRVLLLDELLQVVAMAVPPGVLEPADFRWQPGQGYVRAVLATLGRERRPLRVPPMIDFGVGASCVLAPVAVGEAIFGYLAILAEGEMSGGEDLELQIVQHAATVYALSMLRERMAAEVTRQLKDELFEGLLFGRTQDEQVARERAVRLGYRPELVYRVAVVELAAVESTETVAQRRRLLERLAEWCAQDAAEVLASVRDEELALVIPSTVDASELARAALDHAAMLLPGVAITAGVGGACTTASAIARSYAQARRALETARRFGRRSEVAAFEDLGVYRLLFHVADSTELSGFTDQVLGPLIEYDQRHSADFVRTLDVFLSNNGNVQATARELSLHVNSVTYRLQRIQAIAGLDLEESEDRLLAQVALKILNGVGT
jgi:PucR family transcriptional regulator, purine catabolism regulatory protein